MAKILTAKVFVKSTNIKCMSVNGNPSYWISFETKDYRLSELRFKRGYTASDAQCGYSATNFVGRMCAIEYHFTPAGNLIIDTMKEACRYD